MATKSPPGSPAIRYTPPHEEYNEEPIVASNYSSPQQSHYPTPRSSPALGPTQPQPQGSPQFLARGNPPWADIVDGDDMLPPTSGYYDGNQTPQPAKSTPPRYSKYSAFTPQQLADLKGKKTITESVSPKMSSSMASDLKGKSSMSGNTQGSPQTPKTYHCQTYRSASPATSEISHPQRVLPESSTRSLSYWICA
jgi:hypothetical protein